MKRLQIHFVAAALLIVIAAGVSKLLASASRPAIMDMTGELGVPYAFLAKLDPSRPGASSLVYSTVIGRLWADFAGGVAVDSAGNAVVAGYTASTSFPTTDDAFQRLLNGNGADFICCDAFVAVLDTPPASGPGAGPGQLLFSTLLGGSAGESPYYTYKLGIALDADGNIYVAGNTSSTDFPVTPTAFQPLPGGGDAFVAKISTAH